MNQDNQGEVLSIRSTFIQELKKRQLKITLWTLFALTWTTISLIWLYDYVFIFPLFWIVLLIWIGIVHVKSREIFWKEVALKFQWAYAPYRDTSSEKALIFAQGGNTYAKHGISGDCEGQAVHIFEFQYSTGSAKHRQTHTRTIFEIKFSGTFPHLYLNYENNAVSRLFLTDKVTSIPIPHEFDQKFQLYSPKEYEIEALEIFTPEIFSALLDMDWDLDMEILDGEIVAYKDRRYDNFQDIYIDFTKVKKIITLLSSRLNKHKLTSIGDMPTTL
jgi:hypothetical protein